MAGSSNIGEEADNPVAINATAMVDVIFCLCLFFMCSFHFKQLEGKLETWLPRGGDALNPATVKKLDMSEIRIILEWDPTSEALSRRVGGQDPARDDASLMKSVLDLASGFEKLHVKDFPVLLDAARNVPWKEVVHVMDLCKKEKLDRIEFAGPSQPKPASRPGG